MAGRSQLALECQIRVRVSARTAADPDGRGRTSAPGRAVWRSRDQSTPAAGPRPASLRFMLMPAARAVVLVGLVIGVVGLAMIPLPGPGHLVMGLGAITAIGARLAERMILLRRWRRVRQGRVDV